MCAADDGFDAEVIDVDGASDGLYSSATKAFDDRCTVTAMKQLPMAVQMNNSMIIRWSVTTMNMCNRPDLEAMPLMSSSTI